MNAEIEENSRHACVTGSSKQFLYECNEYRADESLRGYQSIRSKLPVAGYVGEHSCYIEGMQKTLIKWEAGYEYRHKHVQC